MLRRTLVVLTCLLVALLLVPSAASALTTSQRIAKLERAVATLQKQVSSLRSQVKAAAPVLALAPYVSLTQNELVGVRGPNIVFSGANVHVLDPDWHSQRGNLIVGNDGPPSYPHGDDYRSGSNNLIVGDGHTFVGSGCFIAGAGNMAYGSSASISGGYGNAAWGLGSVSGGMYNQAGGSSTVCGGESNIAWGSCSTVGGGRENKASGTYSTVSGGAQITLNTSNGWAAGTPGDPQVAPFNQAWFLSPLVTAP